MLKVSREANKPNNSRCAIYTRKSSEEGLDQDYNSLHAQRDACEAYIRSQVGEGWTAIVTAYDDGGISGGTMDRPGLKRLMADVDAGKIDVVVVYKVDRLTRSLTDFAKIVDRFDARAVSFVSVTQAFNTTSSMGRLTLNVLLSFAQFEREVTGERIRDKIAASKKKGMWMGGVPPLGYDRPTSDKTHVLVVNKDQAELVRRIFELYVELKSVHLLQRRLAADGVRSKITVSQRSGHSRGGDVLNRGALFHLLRNRTYLGEIVHGAESYPGLHPGIVDRQLFDSAGQVLSINAPARVKRSAPASAALLKRLVFDADGLAMTPTISHGQSGRRYRYYVSTSALQGRAASSKEKIRRLPAPQMEALVLHVLERLCGRSDANAISGLRRVDVKPYSVQLLIDRVAMFGDGANPMAQLRRIQKQLADEEAADLTSDADLRITIPRRLKFAGGRTWLTNSRSGKVVSHGPSDPAIAKALKAAHAKLSALGVGPHTSNERLADAQGAGNLHLRLISRLAFMAPDIQEAILEGRLARHWNISELTRDEVPLAWADQRIYLGLTS